MRLNKTCQYGMLIILYLSHAGRASSFSIAEGLGVSKLFLDQVARKLRMAGLLKSTKGYGGGYEVVGEPTVEEVITVLSPIHFLNKREAAGYAIGCPEERAFLNLCKNLQLAITPTLRRKVVNVGKELVANEMATLSRAPASKEYN